MLSSRPPAHTDGTPEREAACQREDIVLLLSLKPTNRMVNKWSVASVATEESLVSEILTDTFSVNTLLLSTDWFSSSVQPVADIGLIECIITHCCVTLCNLNHFDTVSYGASDAHNAALLLTVCSYLHWLFQHSSE